MKTVVQDELLTRYLLGELSAAERERVEEEFVFDERYTDLWDELEANVVDAYVEGVLTPQQRLGFERRFLVTAERKAALQAAYLAKVYRDRLAERPAPPVWVRYRLLAAAASLAIVLAGAIGWQLFHGRQAKPVVKTFAQSVRPQAVLPVPPVQTEVRLPRAITQETAKSPEIGEGAPKVAVAPVPEQNVVPSEVTTVSTPPAQMALVIPPVVEDSPHDAAANAAMVAKAPVPRVSEDGPLADLQRALEAKYALTVPTADKTDIVTTGAVLILKKGGLVTTEARVKNLYMNTYVGGNIVQKNAVASVAKKMMGFARFMPALPVSNGVTGAERTFVKGEKLWVTGIEVKEAGIVFTLFSDAYSDVRYGGTLTLPFEKGSTPNIDAALAKVADVFDVQPPDDVQLASAHRVLGGRGIGAIARAGNVNESAGLGLTVYIGENIDQVVSAIGQPRLIGNLGAKKIYFYKDMKIVFNNGKVIEIQ